MFFLQTLYWVLFVITFFLVINQLGYQEHSTAYNWYKEAPAFHALWFGLIAFAILAVIILAFLHDWRRAVLVAALGMVWIIFFLMYNRIIELDVKNKITAGDLPDAA